MNDFVTDFLEALLPKREGVRGVLVSTSLTLPRRWEAPGCLLKISHAKKKKKIIISFLELRKSLSQAEDLE